MRSGGFLSTAGYGSLEVGVSSVESFLRLYLLIYYTDRVGIDPRWAGFAVSLGVLWDAVMDPVVGTLCDRTKTRFGRRLPWIIISAPLFAISVLLTFSVPMSLSSAQKIMWLFACNIAVNTSMAALSIPHLALGSDVSEGAEMRTKLYAWRMLMSVIGLLVGVAVPAIVRTQFAETGLPIDSVTAGIFSVIVVVTTAVTVVIFLPKVREMASAPGKVELSLPLNAVLRELRRPAFMGILLGYAVATFGQGLNSSLALYYYKYCLEFAESDLQKTLLVFMAVLIVSLPLWVIASRHYKKNVLLAVGVLTIGLLTMISYPLLPPGRVDLAMLVGGLGGVALGCIALFESHLTDLMETYKLGESANARVFGIWKFLAKSARAGSIAVSGVLLSWIGYDPNIAVTDQLKTDLAFIFGPVVGIFFVLGSLAIWIARPKSK